MNKPHRVCRFGHEVTPSPSSLSQGRGLCRACAGKDPAMAWQAFQKRVAELGGQVLEPEWLGCMTPHRLICKAGHESTSKPNTVQQGRGLCSTCAGNDTHAAERAFRERIAQLGGQIIEPEWLGSKNPHRVIDAQGHLCHPRPADVLRGHGPCLTCAGKDPAVTERAFRASIAAIGGQVIEPTWLGARKMHRIVCAQGHEGTVHPVTLVRGGEACATCAGRAPGQPWQAFKDRVAELGGTVIEPRWLGNGVPHRVICQAGHECTPRPGSVAVGQGICRFCAHNEWDIFYVVVNDAAQRVKFGITTHNPRQRLKEHRRHGYTRAIRIMTDVPDAASLEHVVQSALLDAGFKPVWGREYYEISAMAVILDIADNWPCRVADAA